MPFLTILLLCFSLCTMQGQSVDDASDWRRIAIDSNETDAKRAIAYCRLAELFFYQNIDDYQNSLQSAVSLVKDSSSIEMAYVYYTEALQAVSEAAFQTALSKSLLSINLARQYKDTELLMSCYLILSEVYSFKGLTVNTVAAAFKALQLSESVGKKADQTFLHLCIAKRYLNLGQFQKAKGHLQDVQAERLAFSFKRGLPLKAIYELEMARFFNQTEQWDSVKVRCSKAIRQAIDASSKRQEAAAYKQLGIAYLGQDSMRLSKSYFRKAEKIFSALDADIDLADINSYYGQIDLSKKQFKSAQFALKKTMQFARETRSMYLAQRLYKQLANTSMYLSNYEDALKYYRQHTIIQDSIFSLDVNRAITEIEVKHKTGVLTREKEEQAEKIKNQQLAIEISKLKNNQNSYIIIGLLSGLLLLIIIGLLIFRQGALKTQIRETELEQRALRSQMNPHFMFNSLNSIQSLIATDKNAEASIYLAKFARLMRRILQNSRESYIPLSQEIEFLDNYIELEQKRFEEAFEYQLDDSQIEDSHFVMIPPLVIQPFIENAIIHGLLRKSEKGTLKVTFSEYSQYLIKCCIEDDGIGRKASAVYKNDTQQESLGVKITEQRLQYLTIKEKITEPFIRFVDLKDDNGSAVGTQVELLLPIKYKV